MSFFNTKILPVRTQEDDPLEYPKDNNSFKHGTINAV